MDKLKNFRCSLNLDQTEMAKEIGVSFSYYTKIESGFKKPSYSFLCKLKNRYPKVNIDKMFFSKTKS